MSGEKVSGIIDAVPAHIDQQVIDAAVRRGELIQQVSTDIGRSVAQTMKPTENNTDENNVHQGQGDFIIA